RTARPRGGPGRGAERGPLSARLKLYLVAVGIAAAVVLAVVAPELLEPRAQYRPMFNYGLWTAICVISESLWLGTLSGAGTVTMASSAGLATAMLWGRGPSTWIVAVSTLIAEVFVLKKPLTRALFN